MRRIQKRLTAEMNALRGANAAAVITTLNPIIRGWAAYYRNAVSRKAFSSLDDHLWRLTLQVGQPHPRKQAEALGHRPLAIRRSRKGNGGQGRCSGATAPDSLSTTEDRSLARP
jgi:hypothetical protein